MTRDLRLTSRWTPSFLPCPWPPAHFSTRLDPAQTLTCYGEAAAAGREPVGLDTGKCFLLNYISRSFLAVREGGKEGGLAPFHSALRPSSQRLGHTYVQQARHSPLHSIPGATPLEATRRKEGRKEGRRAKFSTPLHSSKDGQKRGALAARRHFFSFLVFQRRSL